MIGAAGAGRLGSRSAGEDSIINDILSDGEPGYRDVSRKKYLFNSRASPAIFPFNSGERHRLLWT